MIIVSACLAGVRCRYNGEGYAIEKIGQLLSGGKVLPVCPEQMGGLPTPRPAAEIREGRVVTKEGMDVTEFFCKGAQEVLRLAELANCKQAILKARSPSCGYGRIYDGTFSKTLVCGNGILAEMLSRKGIRIFTEETFDNPDCLR
ncbi:MAG: DUF523 domain-containing protein [Desulfobacterales bacterium]